MDQNYKDHYDDAFFKQRNNPSDIKMFKGMFLLFNSVFEPASVVELGCATGLLLLNFKEKGVDVQGYDVGEAALKYAKDQSIVEVHDCTQPIPFKKLYDLAICLEVAEHVPTHCSEGLVDNLARATSKAVIFSAAPVGQGGVGHINEQPWPFWMELWEARGWREDVRLGKAIRLALMLLGAHSWYVNNTHILLKDS